MRREGEKKSVTSQTFKIVKLWDWLAYSQRIATRDELIRLGEIYIGLGRHGQNVRPPCPFFSPEENFFFQMHIQII